MTTRRHEPPRVLRVLFDASNPNWICGPAFFHESLGDAFLIRSGDMPYLRIDFYPPSYHRETVLCPNPALFICQQHPHPMLIPIYAPFPPSRRPHIPAITAHLPHLPRCINSQYLLSCVYSFPSCISSNSSFFTPSSTRCISWTGSVCNTVCVHSCKCVG